MNLLENLLIVILGNDKVKKFRVFVCILGLASTVTSVCFGDYEFLIKSIACGCWGFMLAHHNKKGLD